MKNFKFLFFVFGLTLIALSSCENDPVEDLSHDSNIISELENTRCASEQHMEKLLENPLYAAERKKRIEAFEQLNAKGILKSACGSPVLIPVAVHFQGVGSSNNSCLTDLAIRQIDILNQDYSGTNGDITKWTGQASSYFPGVGNGEACLRFVMADQNHPPGYGLNNGDPAVTINQTNGDQVNDWSGYLNIFVQSGIGYLGYAPLGGAGNGDGVVIDATAFGAGSGCGSVTPEAPYNLGRTVTHEVGHYLLLDHIWGNGCNVDDDVADTPDQSNDYYGCPNLGEASCGSADMHMNYMDYTNDACMYMFSAGQSVRMENYVSSNLSSLTNNAGNVYSGSGGTGGGGGGGSGQNDLCDAPGSSTVEIINATSVRVNWPDIPEAIKYRIRYRKVNTSAWITKSSNISQKRLNNLSGNTDYEFQLKTRCPEGWTSWSPKSNFNISGNTSEPNFYRLVVTLDDYGSETTWYIVDVLGNDLYSGGSYQDGRAGTVIEQELNLASGCYYLEIHDDWGDGMCCDYGEGSIEILNANNQTVAFSDGYFGTYDFIDFCVDGSGLRIRNQEKDNKRSNRGSKSKK